MHLNELALNRRVSAKGMSMSAITGIFCCNGNPIDANVLTDMTDRLSHRGPDGSATWHAGPIGLGHCMLFTTPESLHEQLPFVEGPCAITADGRIDNRAELIAACALDEPPEAVTDSALILHSYMRWGEDCVNHFVGDFAFAIWDGRRKELFCARDHFGVKPFYYYHRSDSIFAFASEIKALFCVPQVPRRLDEVRVTLDLAKAHMDTENTSFVDVLRLPPACTLTVRSDGIVRNQYWSLDPTYELDFNTDEEYEQAFRDVFAEAVRCRLRSVSPVGFELSGGLDSSSVVCMAREIQRHKRSERTQRLPLHTFSVLFDAAPESDERYYMKTVIDQGDVEPHFIHQEQFGATADTERMLWHADEPRYVPAGTHGLWITYNVARNTGMRVLMDGRDGDTVVSYGEDYLLLLAKQLKWRTLFHELREFNQGFGTSLRQDLWELVIAPLIGSLIPTPLREAHQRLTRGTPNNILDDAFIKRDFARRANVAQNLTTPHKIRPQGTPRDRHYLGLISPWEPFYFELQDKIAAAFSIEVRHPFYDRRVVEFCLALPPEQKLRDGYNRSIVRRALGHYLPDEVRERKSKAAGDQQINNHLRRYERARMEDILFASSWLIEPYMDLNALRNSYNKALHESDGNLMRTWPAVVLGTWLLQIVHPTNECGSK